jgi:hypothetical protein
MRRKPGIPGEAQTLGTNSAALTHCRRRALQGKIDNRSVVLGKTGIPVPLGVFRGLGLLISIKLLGFVGLT